MIYVAVGTQKFQFNRLLIILDELVTSGVIKEEVFAQIGNCTYAPTHYAYKNFLSKEEFNEYISNSSLLITHSGVGTIISGLKQNKPVIVMPRLAKYGEHVDDHQFQIAESFAAKDLILMCGENDDLSSLIDEARIHVFDQYVSQRKQMVSTIREYIKTIQ